MTDATWQLVPARMERGTLAWKTIGPYRVGAPRDLAMAQRVAGGLHLTCLTCNGEGAVALDARWRYFEAQHACARHDDGKRVYYLGFGKHKGEEIRDVPIGYLQWVVTAMDSAKTAPFREEYVRRTGVPAVSPVAAEMLAQEQQRAVNEQRLRVMAAAAAQRARRPVVIEDDEDDEPEAPFVQPAQRRIRLPRGG